MFSVILIILSLKLSESLNKDICELLRPNGVFDGVNAYTLYKERQLALKGQKYWTGKYRYTTEHWMYKNGVEWRFKIHLKEKWIEFKENTIRRIGNDMNPVILQFSTFVGQPESEGVMKKRIVDACYVIIKLNNKTELHCKRGPYTESRVWKGTNTQFDPSLSVAFNSNAGQTNEYITLMSKTNRKRVQYYSIMNRQLFNETECKGCVVPKFVRQLNSEWIIDAIVDYGWDDFEKGYLIFLNIDNKPKYCLTPKGKDLSCKLKNLMPYGFDCDTKGLKVSQYLDNMGGSDDFPVFWIVIIALVIISIIIVISIAGVFRIKKFKKSNNNSKKDPPLQRNASSESIGKQRSGIDKSSSEEESSGKTSKFLKNPSSMSIENKSTDKSGKISKIDSNIDSNIKSKSNDSKN